MRLTELTKTYKGPPDPDVLGLTQDSRQVREGWLFAALPGSRYDGREFVGTAIENGACAVVTDADVDLTKFQDNVVVLADENPRRLFSLMAAKFYKNQPDFIAAVTGTNGKTSTVEFAQQLWTLLGVKAVSMGTLGVRGGGMTRSASLTTPDPVSLHAVLADLASGDVDHLALEASSHGLHQCRLDGVKVRVAAFTNLSHDHLDYHETMEEYLQAKARLFKDILLDGGVAVLNEDVPEFENLRTVCQQRDMRLITYGYEGEDICLVERLPVPGGQWVHLNVYETDYELVIPLVGAFQVMNALCALGIVMAEDSENDERTARIIHGLKELKGVPGRIELVPGHSKGAVYVDYAHTPDALRNVLESLRPHTQKRLICVVGCGGDRDSKKRVPMGEIASEYADLTVVTDDNPRTEDPKKIRAQILEGVPQAKEIGDRRKAIKWAVDELGDGDVLLIAGKGHEQGQVVGNTVHPFNDFEEAQKAIGVL